MTITLQSCNICMQTSLLNYKLYRMADSGMSGKYSQPTGTSNDRNYVYVASVSGEATAREKFDNVELDGDSKHHDNKDQYQNSSRQELLFSTYRTYKRRWFILATMAVLNISNAMAWICFAAVTNYTAEYFQVSVNAVNWFSLVYLVVAIPMGLVVAWELDTYGLRLAILCGAWLNFFGILLRYVGTLFAIPPSSQYIIVMAGQTVAAIAQPFLLFSPTKMAALWFADNQRATANMLASMSNPLGILFSFVVSALLVSEAADVPTMLWVFIIPAGVGVIMATFGVRSSAPPTPPSKSADSEHETFKEGLKLCVKSRPFVILFFTFGAGYGIFNALSTFLNQIVCPIGYGDDFAGLVGALMLGFGLIGALIAGLIVDKTKAFIPVVKICYTLAVAFIIILSISSKFAHAGAGILVGGIGFGLFGLAQFTISLELGVESTYPVAEGTSACLLQISGQLQGIILIIIGQVAAKAVPVSSLPDQKCIDLLLPNATSTPASIATQTQSEMTSWSGSTSSPEQELTVSDMTIPLFVYAGYGILITIILIFFFRTKYRRLEAEREGLATEPIDDTTKASAI